MPAPLSLSCPRCLLGRAKRQLVSALQFRYLAHKDPMEIELPPEPTTCCMSGCANCVWIEYAQAVAKLLGDNDERAREIVLAKIKDPNLRMFLELELRNVKLTQNPNAQEPKK